MISVLPSGHFADQAHYYPLRVFFEDVDMTGVVHHPTYLKFMERARSDALRLLDIDHRKSMADGLGYFAIADISIKYLSPAYLDDVLTVISQIHTLRAASWTVHQRVMRGEQEVAYAELRVAFLAPNGRPARQPQAWTEAYQIMVKLAVTEDQA